MVGRSQGRRIGVPLATGALAALVLGGCASAQQAGAAAIVNGTAISDQAVQRAADQLSNGTEQGQAFSPSEVVTGLVIGEFALPAAEKAGKGVSTDTARTYLPKLSDPTPETLDYVRTVVAIRNLDAAAQRTLVQSMKDASISVNPRYGTFNPAAFDSNTSPLSPENRDWLKPTSGASPAPSAP